MRGIFSRKNFIFTVSTFLLMITTNISTANNVMIFPDEVEDFANLTEIQQKQRSKAVEGDLLRGVGEVKDIEECGIMSQSKLHKFDCYEIVLESEESRAVLYVGEKHLDKLSTIRKGDFFGINNCYVVGMQDWGFFSTVYCDVWGSP